MSIVPTQKEINEWMRQGSIADDEDENPYKKHSPQWNSWQRGYNNARLGHILKTG